MSEGSASCGKELEPVFALDTVELCVGQALVDPATAKSSQPPCRCDLDAVANRLDEAVAARDADYLRTSTVGGEVSTLGNGEAQVSDLGFCTEPPDGIEPSTYALRVRRSSRLS